MTTGEAHINKSMVSYNLFFFASFSALWFKNRLFDNFVITGMLAE